MISANQPDCLKLRSDLRQQSFSGWITVADSSVPQIYALSAKSEQQLPEVPSVLREAISLARFKLNPLAEVLNIWHERPEQNGCLSINLHPLQNMLPQSDLQNALEQVAIEIVNNVGVDLVDSCVFHHLQALLQFVCGLGPRKAK